MGSTLGFGPGDEGSNPSPRASAPDLALYGDEPAGERVDRRRSTYSSNFLPAPCHFCGGPSWLADETGAVHPCCVLEWRRTGGCLACQTSDRLNKDHRRRVLTGQNRNASLSPHTKGEPPLTESEI